MRSKMLAVAVLFAGCVMPPMMTSADGGRAGPMKADGGAGGGGTTTSRDAGGPVAPVLETADARVAGRTGRDVRVAVTGTDRNLDATSARVRLIDGSGAMVSEAATSLEGKKWLGEAVSGAAWARGVVTPMGPIAQVGIRLLDSAGLESDELVVAVALQPVVARGATCDPTFLENRCEPGLGCRGMPPVCDEGLAPTVTRMAFFRGTSASGPSILIEGSEPEDDLATVRFEFQNLAGQAISIDSDGDGTPDLQQFDHDAAGTGSDGTWFVRLQSGTGLDGQVPRLVATPIDAAGHSGAAKIVSPTVPTVKMNGQPCDARGFDVCAAGLTCSPGVLGAMNKCSSSAPMRTSQCSSAPVLLASSGPVTVMGTAEGGSLWDAPAGCSSADPTGRPEGVAVLRLSDRANHVRVSTIGPATNFDTTLYVMPGCPNDTSTVLACSDDAPMASGASEVVLENLPAGDYLIVVDSFDPNGGLFELHATVE